MYNLLRRTQWGILTFSTYLKLTLHLNLDASTLNVFFHLTQRQTSERHKGLT